MKNRPFAERMGFALEGWRTGWRRENSFRAQARLGAILLAPALGLSGCVHAGNGSGMTASANYSNLSAAHGQFPLGGKDATIVRSSSCSLDRGERAAVLGALARVAGEEDRDSDSDFYTGPEAGSGLLIVFRKAGVSIMTVMLQAGPPRQGQARAYIRVNDQLASIALEDLARIQTAVRRSGCRMTVHRRSVA